MFRRSKQGSIDVVSGAVSLTAESIEQLSRAFEECLADGPPKAVFDMEHTPLIDSVGLERLLDIREKFEQRAGLLKIAAPNPLCSDILSVTGVGSYFEVHSEVQTAVGSFIQ
jgi:anti-anti-sigma factor